jgi:ribosomal protein S18 acetylase RimI-like enzyme
MAASIPPGVRAAWAELWPETERILSAMHISSVWAMTTYDWLIDRLAESGFTEQGRVIAYSRPASRPVAGPGDTSFVARMQASDLSDVERLDHAAFEAPWQMDSDALRETLRRSVLAVVYRMGRAIVGYLMAVPVPEGIHIARIAVRPDRQRRGIGQALVIHLLQFGRSAGAPRVTVNTQMENRQSQRLYASLDFSETGDSYPVFRRDLAP